MRLPSEVAVVLVTGCLALVDLRSAEEGEALSGSVLEVCTVEGVSTGGCCGVAGGVCSCSLC